MKSMILSVCLLACTIMMLNSCKKELFETDEAQGKGVKMEQMSATKSRCETDPRMENLYQNRPGYRSEIIDGRMQEMLRLEKNNGRSVDDLPLLTIPVHVIVIHRPGHSVGSQTNISDQRIASQIAALNLDFLRKNADAAKTPSVFKVSGSQIQFCLASKDANGKATTGITRYATNQNFDNNELALKRTTRWDPKRYLNIWIAPDIEGLGYAYLPTRTALPSADEDGVVILTEAFGGPGSGAIAPFNLGRTLTHEVGHYLGLDHIWGDGCQVDDGISDTPQQREENYDCPSHPSPSCNNNGDMFMNYMDYVNDDCMNAFTVGQVAYMRSILATSRVQLVMPGRTDCPSDNGTNTPTCNDGIRNGDETGIDCGGSCAPCQTTAATDAGLTNLTYTTSAQNCNQSVRFKVVLNNFGTTTLTSAVIDVMASGTLLQTYSWTGSLASKGKTTVTLPAVNMTSGQKSITARSKNPNGKPDSNPSNDQVTTTVNISGANQYTLTIKPDDYGADISWKVKDSQGNTVAQGGGYPDFNRTVIRETFCLPQGCYKLIMYDSYGDGICCDYGNGWYELTDASGEIILDSDGYYGYRETQSFCLDANNILSRQQIERDSKVNRPDRRSSTRVTGK